MNTFKEITERIGEWGDSRIIILPEDTARVIMSAMEDFIEELKEVTIESCIEYPYSAVVVSTAVELIARSVSDLRKMLLIIKASKGDPDVNYLRELIYSARLMLQIACHTVTENDHVFKQTSRYEEIEDCLVAVLLLLHKLVLLHDKHGWVTSGAVYSEN